MIKSRISLFSDKTGQYSTDGGAESQQATSPASQISRLCAAVGHSTSKMVEQRSAASRQTAKGSVLSTDKLSLWVHTVEEESDPESLRSHRGRNANDLINMKS